MIKEQIFVTMSKYFLTAVNENEKKPNKICNI